MRFLIPSLLSFVLLFQGCITQTPYPEASLANEDAACLHWFETVDKEIAEHSLEDPASARIADFPQFRADRFLASLRNKLTSEDAFAAWLERLQQLDKSARKWEFANLPPESKQQLISKLPPGESFAQAVQRCGKRLTAISLNNPEHKKRLLQQIEVPDSYQTWKRYAGVYALSQYAAELGIERLHRELNAPFQLPLAQLPVEEGRLLRYAPPPSEPLHSADITAMLHKAYANPLTIPLLPSQQLQRLYGQFAPIWEIDSRNDNDEIGAVTLDTKGKPHIDTSRPTVYVMHAFTRYHDEILLQLIYQIWLPAREKTGIFDLYGGPLDSVIWRVTLSRDGRPIAYDSIHACGCYYMLFPAQGYKTISPQDGAEQVLSPMTLPAIMPEQRLRLHLENRTHYLQQIALVSADPDEKARHYIWQAAEQLRSLPLPNGIRRSLFRADGIVDASERTERFLLWPFGVPSPGAMRQWGTHAIAFIGRRHFDDPFLMEKILGNE